MGRSTIEETQNRILGQFKRDIRMGNSDTIITRSIEAGKKQAQKREQKKIQNEGKGICVSGLNPEAQDKAKESLAKKEQDRLEQIRKSAESRDRHSILNNALDLFPQSIFLLSEISKDDLEDVVGVNEIIHEDSSIVVNLRLDRALSSSLRCFLDVTYQKPIFVKGPTFDIDKKTVKSTREIKETVKINATFGDVLRFRKTFLAPIGDIVKKYNVQDESNGTNDIWEF